MIRAFAAQLEVAATSASTPQESPVVNGFDKNIQMHSGGDGVARALSTVLQGLWQFYAQVLNMPFFV